MSEDFTDDNFMDEEEGSSNRTVGIVAGALVGLLLLIVLATAIVAMARRGNGQEDQVAARLAENMTIEAQNLLVTQTIVAQQTEAARSTDTPTPTETPIPPTATPTETPRPTDTPVVQPVEDEDEGEGEEGEEGGTGDEVAAVEGTPTPVLAGTTIFGGVQPSGGPTPIPGAGGGTLPQTGMGAWGALAAAAIFIGLAFAARRLRTT